MPAPLSWEIEHAGGTARVTLVGDITEQSNLRALLAQLSTPVTLNLSGIRRINSAGLREWIDFAEALRQKVNRVVLDRCSVAFVHQLNMIEGFSGGAVIQSVFAPYFCGACSSEHSELVDLSGASVTLADTMTCPKCGGSMEFDDVPEYLSFRNEA
jgi:ABC-type transporter Mla MlaB component